jgi:F420H(2)-dependent biliverdin reductase
MSTLTLTASDQARLETARNLWLATVRPNGAPHLVPIWFVWLDDNVYLCTSKESVKARNIMQNSRIAFALEDGDDPVLIEGTAQIVDSVPQGVVEAFAKKFDWNIQGDGTYNAVIEITPLRVVL